MFDTKEAFLVDTLDYYLGDITQRRCIGLHGMCKYNPAKIKKPNSDGCAIGRHVKDEETKNKLDIIGDINSIFHTNRQYLLPNWMVVFGQEFLRDVQIFHDTGMNWDENKNTLSSSGKLRLNFIISDYKLDEKLFTKYLN